MIQPSFFDPIIKPQQEMPSPFQLSGRSLSEEVLATLSICKVHDNVVKIPSQLPKEVYDELNEVFTRLGGGWKGGRVKGHIFNYSPDPAIKAVIAARQFPHKNPNAFYPSTPIVVNAIREEMEDYWWLPGKVLEPSGGQGAIAELVGEAGRADDLTIIELDPLNCEILRQKGYDPIQSDFLTHHGDYSIILMNPPFSVTEDKTAYLTHIQHAWKQLTNPGILVAITPSGWLYNSATNLQDFREFVYRNGTYQKLPQKAFSASGTDIDTTLVTLLKDDGLQRRMAEPHQGHPSYATWQVACALENDGDYARNIAKLLRPSDRESITSISAKIGTELNRAIKATLKTIRASNAQIWATDDDLQYLRNYFCEQETHRQ